MDEYKRLNDSSDEWYQDDAAVAAQSVLTDFSELVAMLDRQLASLADADALARSHVVEARAAAERGLKLSKQLVGLLAASERN
jgi:hypothetical protein